MITARSLTKRFGAVAAVDGLDFSVARGELFGIVGPDGAGKSTLLRMLSTILVPTAGEVLYAFTGRRADSYSIKEKIAYMPQRFGLYEDLTVEENIMFFGKLYGMNNRDIAARLPALYGFSNLGPFSGKLSGQLSGGMKQKLGLACCLVHDPELVLLDEPTNGVDPVSRREFWKILYDLLGRRVTIVVSTAYLDEAERCSRVALMYRGRFLHAGEPAAIRSMAPGPLVEIACDAPARAEAVLREEQEYRGVIRSGQALRIFLDRPARHGPRIRKLLGGRGIAGARVRTVSPTLEDVFVEVIRSGDAR